MKLRNVLIGLLGLAVVVVGGIWFFLLRSDAPPPANLEDAVSAVRGETTTTKGTADVEPPATTTVSVGTVGPTAGLDGTWVIDQSVSFAGYRIDEELASIGATTAVGRTSEIDASLTVSGTGITDVSVTVDMTTLQSDQSRRDGAMETRGLETNRFPTATFALTGPLDLGTIPGEGETIAAVAVGDLTLHGVTRQVSLNLEGSLVEGTIIVVGSTDVTIADFEIEAPTGFSVLGIADVGQIEVQLAFVR